MAHDIFISYSSKDKVTADALCNTLEKNKIKCWMAPRDILAGEKYSSVIESAINACSICVFVFSEKSKLSPWCESELSIAFSERKTIIPFKIDESILDGEMRLMLNNKHWIEAYPEPEKSFEQLIKSIQNNLGIPVAVNNLEPLNVQNDSANVSNHVGDNTQLEYLYQMGMAAVAEYDINMAFASLVECAISNYKDSQQQISYICTSRPRLYMIDEDNFTFAIEMADKGDAFAQFVAGQIYRLRYNDADKCAKYTKLSANQQCPFGIGVLADLYVLGFGLKKSTTQYKKLINQAIFMNDGCSIVMLANDYLNGWLYTQNGDKAISLLNKAMSMNVPESFDVIGRMYWDGTYIERNLVKAEELYNKAISLGYYESYKSLASLYMYEPISFKIKDTKAGLVFLRKGANKGVVCCISGLAMAYHFGNGVQMDLKNAIKWYEKASKIGDRYSFYMLGLIYYYGGDGVQEDNTKAWKYFMQGYLMNASNSCYMLGVMCLDGYGQEGQGKEDCIRYFEESGYLGGHSGGESLVKLYNIFKDDTLEPKDILTEDEYKMLDYSWAEKDNDRAVAYLKRASNLDYVPALYCYGVLLTQIESPYSDEFEGKIILEKALKRGDKRAALRLGYLYDKGIAVSVDKVKSEEYFKIAADADIQDAIVPYYTCLIDKGDHDVENKDLILWVEKGVELNIVQSVLDLGVFNQLGCYGITKDITKAIDLYTKAANLGSKQAALNIGDLYYEGEDIEKDNHKALEWYDIAIGLGCGDLEDKFRDILIANIIQHGIIKGDLFDKYCWHLSTFKYGKEYSEQDVILDKLYGRVLKDKSIEAVLNQKPSELGLEKYWNDANNIFNLYERICREYSLDPIEFVRLSSSDLLPYIKSECVIRYGKDCLRCFTSLLNIDNSDMTKCAEAKLNFEAILNIAEKSNNPLIQDFIIAYVESQIEVEAILIANGNILKYHTEQDWTAFYGAYNNYIDKINQLGISNNLEQYSDINRESDTPELNDAIKTVEVK